MAARRKYRRSRKTTPLREAGFVMVLIVIIATLGLRQGLEDTNLAVVAGIFILIVLFLSGSFYLWLTYRQQMKRKALRALQLSHVDDMEGRGFEEYVAELLRFQGYRAHTTQLSGDYGVDVIAAKGGIKIAVQVKRRSERLNQDPIREALGGMTIKKYGCTKAMVVTNSTFTKSAKFLASQSGCELVDREKLSEWILMFQGDLAVENHASKI